MPHIFSPIREPQTGQTGTAVKDAPFDSGRRSMLSAPASPGGRRNVPFEEFQGTRSECVHCALRSFCAVSSPGESRPVAFGQQVVRKGMVMFRQGDPVEGIFAVCHGGVKRVHSERLGEEEVLTIVGPGHMFGNEDLTCETHLTTTTVLQDGVIAFLSRATAQETMGKDPIFARDLYHSLAEWTRSLVHRSSDLSKGGSRLRLARALLRLAEQTGIQTSEGLRIAIPLQRRELAGLIGTEPETVTRLLGAFFEEKVLRELRRGEFLILDLNRLHRMGRL